MMLPTRRAFLVPLTAVALLIVGCSSGGGNHAASTTTIATTSSTAATTTTVSPSHVVADLGKCPSKYPAESLRTINAGVRGLARKLVPISAVKVQVCSYSGNRQAAGRAVLSGSGATVIENETNLLHRTQQVAIAESPTGMSCPGPLYLTFASRTQNVSVTATGCDALTNGVFFAFGTSTWLSELAAYTGCTLVSPSSTVSPNSPTTVDIGSLGPPSNGKGPTGATTCSSI